MKLAAVATWAAERAPLPDSLTKLGVGFLVARARKTLAGAPPEADGAVAADMNARAIAEHTAEANAQHYEVPADFFRRTLGPRLKYSCGYYESGTATLAQAEEAALARTCDHADLRDGQKVLELGCGWGSLSLWMAERYPLSTITCVSNSQSQREYIQAKAKIRGLTNLLVLTRDMNEFVPTGAYDRIVSVEMFEHMANWRALFERLLPALDADGRMFLHVFSHRYRSYRFEAADPEDFIAQHFFTGGLMPSHGLIRQFSDLLEVEDEWRWSGEHYRRTAMDWLANFDQEAGPITALFKQVYGSDAGLWKRRWRLFFLAVAGMFGDNDGDVWGVSHYRLRRASKA